MGYLVVIYEPKFLIMCVHIFCHKLSPLAEMNETLSLLYNLLFLLHSTLSSLKC